MTDARAALAGIVATVKRRRSDYDYATELEAALSAQGLEIRKKLTTVQDMCDERDRLLARISAIVLGNQMECVSAFRAAATPPGEAG